MTAICLSLGNVDAQLEERTPTTDSEKPLTLAELRWCRSEILRLNGAGTAIDQNVYWDIFDYNQRVQRYRDGCLGRTAETGATNNVNHELTESVALELRKAGVALVPLWRQQRSEIHHHVLTNETPILESTEADADTVATLPRWHDVFVIDSAVGDRAHIEWLDDAQLIRRTGWIDKQELVRGEGSRARQVHCRATKGKSLEPDELIRGSATAQRYMLLQVHNPSTQDAYVKLVADDSVYAAFVVAAGTQRIVNGLPKGEFNIAFITGREFSRGCESFVERGLAGRMDQPIVFNDYNYEWAIRLQIPKQKVIPSDMHSYRLFEAL